MKILIFFALFSSLLFSQTLKDKLTTANEFEKGELLIEKKDEKYMGKFTLAVKQEKKNNILEILAIDFKSDEKKTIILYDDGRHGDEIAGDGIYTGTTFIMPGSKNRYFIRSNQGKYDTQVLFEFVIFSAE